MARIALDAATCVGYLYVGLSTYDQTAGFRGSRRRNLSLWDFAVSLADPENHLPSPDAPDRIGLVEFDEELFFEAVSVTRMPMA